MKKNAKKFIIAFAVVVIAGGFIAFNIFNANRMEAANGVARNAPPVQWAYPSEQTMVSLVSARGNVELRERTVVFPETQAQILEVHVSVGDMVGVGDILITYDDSILDIMHDNLAEARLALRQAELGLAATRIAPASSELMAAENQIEAARNNIANIQAQLDQVDLQISQLQDNIQVAQNSQRDVQTLFNNGVATRTELDNAENAVRSLEDQLAILKSQRDTVALGLPLAQDSERLATAQFNTLRNRNTQPEAVNQAQIQQVTIEQARLRISQIERDIAEFEREERAQVAGTVLNVFVEEGETSVTGRPLMEIADVSMRNLVVIAHIPENEAGSIEVGQDVWVSGAGIRQPGHDIVNAAARIERIHPLASQQQIGTGVETVITVEIDVIGTDRMLPGTSVDADIVTNISENTLVVPLMATLSEGGGSNFIYVIGEGDILERRDVILGEFSNMYIEAIGVAENDRVVVSPTPIMYPGMQVRAIGV